MEVIKEYFLAANKTLWGLVNPSKSWGVRLLVIHLKPLTQAKKNFLTSLYCNKIQKSAVNNLIINSSLLKDNRKNSSWIRMALTQMLARKKVWLIVSRGTSTWNRMGRANLCSNSKTNVRNSSTTAKRCTTSSWTLPFRPIGHRIQTEVLLLWLGSIIKWISGIKCVKTTKTWSTT